MHPNVKKAGILWLLILALSSTAVSLRVGIIGGGLSGASSAYYLRKFFSKEVDDLHVTIFEKKDRLAGRIKTIDFDGKLIEVGAAGFVPENKYMFQLANELGLDYGNFSHGFDHGENYGVWDGRKWYQQEPAKSTMLSRAESFLQMERFRLKNGMNYFMRGAESSFESVREFLSPGGIDEFASTSTIDFARRSGIDPSFAFARWLPFIRLHFNQDLSVNAYAGMGSLLPKFSGDYNFRGGNEMLVHLLVERSGAIVHLNTNVRIIRREGTGYQVHFITAAGEEYVQSFDFVIIAAPIESTQLIFENIEIPAIAPRLFYHGFITVISADGLNPDYFRGVEPVPDSIMTVGNTTTKLNSVTYQGKTRTGKKLYKISSDYDIGSEIMKIFLNPERMYVQPWSMTFPPLNPGQDYQPIFLSDRLLYTGGLESIWPTMETAVTSGRNAGLLVKHAMFGKPSSWWWNWHTWAYLTLGGITLWLLSPLLTEPRATMRAAKRASTAVKRKMSELPDAAITVVERIPEAVSHIPEAARSAVAHLPETARSAVSHIPVVGRRLSEGSITPTRAEPQQRPVRYVVPVYETGPPVIPAPASSMGPTVIPATIESEGYRTRKRTAISKKDIAPPPAEPALPQEHIPLSK